MSFNQTIKYQAYRNADGKCEKCGKHCRIIMTDYGYRFPDSEFHHKTSIQVGGCDGLSNCQHLCIACHENTKSYGGF